MSKRVCAYEPHSEQLCELATQMAMDKLNNHCAAAPAQHVIEIRTKPTREIWIDGVKWGVLEEGQ